MQALPKLVERAGSCAGRIAVWTLIAILNAILPITKIYSLRFLCAPGRKNVFLSIS